VKYFREVASDLLETIAFNVSYHAGSKALRRELDRDVIRRALG
jgi:hypothetical protein